MKIKLAAISGLLYCGAAFCDVQTVAMDRIIVQNSGLGEILVLRAPTLTGSGNCHLNQDWYSLFYIPVSDAKTKHIQSIALASYAIGQNVRIHFSADASPAGTTHGETKCLITALEVTNE